MTVAKFNVRTYVICASAYLTLTVLAAGLNSPYLQLAVKLAAWLTVSTLIRV